jgi:3-dehydroquinate dehydratase-1
MKLKPRIVASLGKNAVKDVLQASEADMMEELRSTVQEISRTRASIAKIAVTPSCLQDNLTLLELLLETDMPLSVIAMGKLGRHMRAVAPIYGSALTYGYVSEPTAPGQMSVSELRQLQMLL